jgi:PAS domain S-box-containing protein
VKDDPDIRFNEFADDINDYSQHMMRIEIKYLFSLVGFGIGSFISLIIINLEDISGDISISSRHSHWHHLAIPFLIGILGAIIGYLYGRRHDKKNKLIKKLYISQQTLSLITDNLPALISYVDSDLRYKFINKAHEEWMGVSIYKIYGKRIKEFIGVKNFELIRANIKRVIKGETVSFEGTRLLKNGNENYIKSTIVPHFDANNKLKGFFTLVTDITEIKEREKTINKQKEALLELNATKDKFFSIIAHDLKNPFSSLLGFSELMFKDYEAYSEKTRKELIAMIYETARNTYKLLENLLFWSRSQRGKIKFTPSSLDIKNLADDNIHLLRELASRKNINLKSDIIDGINIYTDKDLVNTVIRNLISNAIKFTPKNGEISITARPIKEDNLDSFIEISVKDTGIGINEESISKLFKIAENLSTPGTDGEQGTGLGLVLCRECIEKCGGKIWVESEIGKGSDFKFSLPLNAEQVNALNN